MNEQKDMLGKLLQHESELSEHHIRHIRDLIGEGFSAETPEEYLRAIDESLWRSVRKEIFEVDVGLLPCFLHSPRAFSLKACGAKKERLLRLLFPGDRYYVGWMHIGREIADELQRFVSETQVNQVTLSKPQEQIGDISEGRWGRHRRLRTGVIPTVNILYDFAIEVRLDVPRQATIIWAPAQIVWNGIDRDGVSISALDEQVARLPAYQVITSLKFRSPYAPYDLVVDWERRTLQPC